MKQSGNGRKVEGQGNPDGKYTEPYRELYFLKWKLKKINPLTPEESVKAIRWVPMARSMILSEAEAAVLTGVMHKSLAWIITQLLCPGPGYAVAGVELQKMEANKPKKN